jgi:hypothetical protein
MRPFPKLTQLVTLMRIKLNSLDMKSIFVCHSCANLPGYILRTEKLKWNKLSNIFFPEIP